MQISNSHSGQQMEPFMAGGALTSLESPGKALSPAWQVSAIPNTEIIECVL